MNSLKRFLCDEEGAVTVDFVVLTAGVVVLGIVVAPPIREGVTNLAIGIATLITEWDPFSLAEPPVN